ncbi:MAG: hypothetical protein KF762_08535 [Acidobacteria bacterium]|jgi:hypothetical protein|nr:hypothetical protein [Acidobacteriota bacterium]
MNLKDQNIEVYSVWVPILPSYFEVTVGRATKTLPDPRVRHYWDGDGELVKGYAPVLGIDDQAWDVYLLYDKDAEWKDAPPKPNYWQEQLGISEETKLDGAKLAVEIDKLHKHELRNQ